jgi:catechol 2,3-dioxygenase-like lactoylglutathione lyase family enzyme
METTAASPLASLDLVVLDCPDPRVLARFYAAVLGWEIVDESDGWATVRGGVGAGMAFQRADDYVPPSWPDGSIPQQSHLDFDVVDLDAAQAAVLALGATDTGEPEGRRAGFRVFLDPAGHPFCLVRA